MSTKSLSTALAELYEAVEASAACSSALTKALANARAAVERSAKRDGNQARAKAARRRDIEARMVATVTRLAANGSSVTPAALYEAEGVRKGEGTVMLRACVARGELAVDVAGLVRVPRARGLGRVEAAALRLTESVDANGRTASTVLRQRLGFTGSLWAAASDLATSRDWVDRISYGGGHDYAITDAGRAALAKESL